MNSYIANALSVLTDPQQTYEAKRIAQEILLNSGYLHQDIEQLKLGLISGDLPQPVIFQA
jgi:hypothetical protein